MLTIFCPVVEAIDILNKYIETGALVTTHGDLMLIDRAVFSDKPAKNIKNRYQVMDEHENVIKLLPSRRLAMEFMYAQPAA